MDVDELEVRNQIALEKWRWRKENLPNWYIFMEMKMWHPARIPAPPRVSIPKDYPDLRSFEQKTQWARLRRMANCRSS